MYPLVKLIQHVAILNTLNSSLTRVFLCDTSCPARLRTVSNARIILTTRCPITRFPEGMKHFPAVKSSLCSSGITPASNSNIFFKIGPLISEPIQYKQTIISFLFIILV
jgi:hypothetical protein